MKKRDSLIIPIIIILSILVPLLVAFLMIFPELLMFNTNLNKYISLPFLHAVLNGFTAILLLLGYILIRKKRIKLHRFSMITAFILSAVFLISYVLNKLTNAPVPFGGEGIIRPIYFFILISHIILSIPVLPLALLSIYRGMTKEYNAHRMLVKWTFPIWMYVAITGVLVYVFMSPYY